MHVLYPYIFVQLYEHLYKYIYLCLFEYLELNYNRTIDFLSLFISKWGLLGSKLLLRTLFLSTHTFELVFRPQAVEVRRNPPQTILPASAPPQSVGLRCKFPKVL